MKQSEQNKTPQTRETLTISNPTFEKDSTIYQKTVAFRTAIAMVMIPCGHIILEPLGVPHGTAEQISLATAGVLFTPEIVLTSIRITIDNIKKQITDTQKKKPLFQSFCGGGIDGI